MKTNAKRILAAILMLVMVISMASCSLFGNDNEDNGEDKSASALLWENATYKEDTTLGTGSKTVYVDVRVYEYTVKITVKTDKANLGDALLEVGLVEGDNGAYGLYVKKVNGITADYDTDGAYWSFCRNGQYLSYGVSSAEISGGENYELVYAK